MILHSFGIGFIPGVSVGFEIPNIKNNYPSLKFLLFVDLLIIRIVYRIFEPL
jgi:hypothetical protein